MADFDKNSDLGASGPAWPLRAPWGPPGPPLGGSPLGGPKTPKSGVLGLPGGVPRNSPEMENSSYPSIGVFCVFDKSLPNEKSIFRGPGDPLQARTRAPLPGPLGSPLGTPKSSNSCPNRPKWRFLLISRKSHRIPELEIFDAIL